MICECVCVWSLYMMVERVVYDLSVFDLPMRATHVFTKFVNDARMCVYDCVCVVYELCLCVVMLLCVYLCCVCRSMHV